MKEFMVQVERAVRPVVAGPWRKLRMREELLVHLESIHAEELVRLGDETAARAETLRRFGDPAALTADLQGTVNFRERIDARLNRVYGWRPGESAARYAARQASLVALLLAFWLALTLVVAETRRPHDGSVPTSTLLLQLFGLMMVIAPLAVFLLVLLYIRIRDALLGAFDSPRSWRRVVGFAALSFFVLPTAGTMWFFLLFPEMNDVAGESTSGRSLALSALAYAIVPAWLVIHARRAGPAEVRLVEWSSLEIPS
jgi:hypothetical protein